MSIAFKIQSFEGPLDLLLQLVEQERLPITEVSLAQITDQYLTYIEESKQIPKEELAEFLLIAARLLLIKSRTLLPATLVPLEESGISLEEQLRMYQQFAHAARRIAELLEEKQFLFPREKIPPQPGVFTPPRTLTPARLSQIFQEILRALVPVIRLPKAAIERVVSIQEKIAALRHILKAQGAMSFHTFVRMAQNKTEIVISFLALLELVKQRFVAVHQEELFQDITVESNGEVSL